MNATRNTFEEILFDFKKDLQPKEVESFQFVTLNDVRETALRIQRDQENLKSMMNMARIESFLEAMNQFGKVIEVFVNASSFVAFVWGPLKFILQTASTWADTFEVLVEAYGLLGEHMPLVEQYEELFGRNPHMRRVLPMIYADILSFHKKAIRFFRGKPTVWRQIFRSTWKDYDTRFKSILDSLNRHKELTREQAALLHYEQSQSDSQHLLRHIQKYEQDRSETLIRVKEQVKSEELKKTRHVFEWLSATQTTDHDHHCFREVRKSSLGSGEWILKDKKVQDWMNLEIPEASILWINGIPGAGKTILASTIVDGCLQNKDYATSYFYCNENDEEKNGCSSIYRGLLSQLLKHCPELLSYCYDKYLTSGELTLTMQSLAEQLLRLFCEKIKKQYVVIDGLDECDIAQRKLVLAFFIQVVEKCDEHDPGKLRVLFISQDYSDIANALRTAAILNITPEDNQNDIRAYVRGWCKKIQVKYNLHGEHLEKVEYIEDSTCIRAKGMFLYAKLVMENLYAQEQQEILLYEIEVYRFPQGLEQAYERIISRLRRSLLGNQWRIACDLLGWMVCAKRPLKWREIQAAVSMNPTAQTVDFESRKLRSNIQDYCGSLVQVSAGNRVELVHTTAKMYITRTEWFHMSTIECNLAALCLSYLTFECFDEETSSDRLRALAFKGTLSFQDYAVAKWFEHVRAIVVARSTPDAKLDDPDAKTALEKFAIALDEFTSRYDEVKLDEDGLETVAQQCKLFETYELYNQLLQLWNHIHRHQAKGPEKRNEVSIKSLGDTLLRNRKLLESLSGSNESGFENQQDLILFYGDKLFKCPKISCYYFHEGFKDAKSRDHHVNRHDRPFKCAFPDCSIVDFGFATNKDRDKHMRFFHPDIEYQSTAFAVEKKPQGKTPYECDICHKKFTRAFHLRSHLRSHAGERPFPCSECGKAFTRSNDCTRHEKNHSRIRV